VQRPPAVVFKRFFSVFLMLSAVQIGPFSLAILVDHTRLVLVNVLGIQFYKARRRALISRMLRVIATSWPLIKIAE
jgi:hypothetical protein